MHCFKHGEQNSKKSLVEILVKSQKLEIAEGGAVIHRT